MVDFLTYFGGLVAFSALVMVMLWASASAPAWARVPILCAPIAAVPLLLWLMRRRRVDGAGLLAEADFPVAEQRYYPLLQHHASPDRCFVASIASGDDGSRSSTVDDTLTVYDVVRNRVAFDLPTPWSPDGLRWSQDNRLHFQATRFPDDAPGVDVELEPHAKMARLRAAGEDINLPFRDVASWFDGFYTRNRRLR